MTSICCKCCKVNNALLIFLIALQWMKECSVGALHIFLPNLFQISIGCLIDAKSLKTSMKPCWLMTSQVWMWGMLKMKTEDCWRFKSLCWRLSEILTVLAANGLKIISRAKYSFHCCFKNSDHKIHWVTNLDKTIKLAERRISVNSCYSKHFTSWQSKLHWHFIVYET